MESFILYCVISHLVLILSDKIYAAKIALIAPLALSIVQV